MAIAAPPAGRTRFHNVVVGARRAAFEVRGLGWYAASGLRFEPLTIL